MGLSDKEHHARAMLMGLRYHHGNGDPFYYNVGGDGVIDISSMIDANTFEPLWHGNKMPTSNAIQSGMMLEKDQFIDSMAGRLKPKRKGVTFDGN